MLPKEMSGSPTIMSRQCGKPWAKRGAGFTSLSQDLSGTASDLTPMLGYNPAGRIASNTRSNDAYAWGGHYAVNRNYTTNGLNQYSAAGPATLSYDGRGNLASDGTRSFTHTAENRLAQMGSSVLLSHDAAGWLSQVVGSVNTLFDAPGGEIVSERDGYYTLLRRYVHGAGGEPLVWYEGTGTSARHWLHADERGSVIALSNDAGNLTNVNSYDEHGIPGSANAGRFQYTGQAWLPDLGMYYYRNRIYSPTLGRFLQTDPIGFGGGMNIYAYVHNDPVNFTDPSGLCDVQPCEDEDPITVTGPRLLQGGGILGLPSNWASAIAMFLPDSPGADGGGGGPGAGDTPQCQGPPPAPGTGATQSALRNQVHQNGNEAASHRYDLFNLQWFRDQVRNGAPWDYKQYDRGFEDFGNYNYGYTGAAMGLQTDFLLRQAGRAQVAAGTSRPEWGDPGYFGGLFGGTPPYGDDPHDQEMIRRGIADRQNAC
jgi:RHS repeat-associated protein